MNSIVARLLPIVLARASVVAEQQCWPDPQREQNDEQDGGEGILAIGLDPFRIHRGG